MDKSSLHRGALEVNFRVLSKYRALNDRRGEGGIIGNIALAYRTMGDHELTLRRGLEVPLISDLAGLPTIPAPVLLRYRALNLQAPSRRPECGG